MAHRRAGAFHSPTEEAGEPLVGLRSAFLRAVEDVCLQAMREYGDLLGQASAEAVAVWADKYFLTAQWCLDAAAAGLRIAEQGGPLRPFLVSVYRVPDMPPPGGTIPLQMEYTWIPYTGEVDPSVFRRRHLAAFTDGYSDAFRPLIPTQSGF